MNESNLLLKKKSLNVISIEGAAPESTWTKTSGVTKNADGTWSFSGASQVDWLRIPRGTSPYPIGENMSIRLRGILNSAQASTYTRFLTRWYQVSGQGEFSFNRWSDGVMSLAIGSISEQANQTTTGSNVLAGGVAFDLYWKRFGTNMLCQLNGNTIYNVTQATQRQINLDWLLGTLFDSSGAPTQGASTSRSNWLLTELTIKRVTS